MAELSPTAQAVLDAVDDAFSEQVSLLEESPISTRAMSFLAAAALRAAAYQVAPARPQLDSCCEHWEQRIRHQFLAIAAELEATNA